MTFPGNSLKSKSGPNAFVAASEKQGSGERRHEVGRRESRPWMVQLSCLGRFESCGNSLERWHGTPGAEKSTLPLVPPTFSSVKVLPVGVESSAFWDGPGMFGEAKGWLRSGD